MYLTLNLFYFNKPCMLDVDCVGSLFKQEVKLNSICWTGKIFPVFNMLIAFLVVLSFEQLLRMPSSKVP